MISDGFESNIIYTGCSDGCIRSLSLHPNAINGEISHLNDSVEKIQIFESKVSGFTFRFILSTTCADGDLYITDLCNINNSKKESVKISKKSKIAEVDIGKALKKTFFADLE